MIIFKKIAQFFGDLRTAVVLWMEDDCSLLSAAVAYYLGLSFFPLLLVLIASLGLFFEYSHFGQDAEQQVLEAISNQLSPMLKEHVESTLTQVRDRASINGPLGLAALFVSSAAIFYQLDRAFDRVWDVKESKPRSITRAIREVIINRLLSFVMLFGLGLLIVVTFVAGLVLNAAENVTMQVLGLPENYWGTAETLAMAFLNTMFFAAIYKTLAKRAVAWADALKGGILAAAIWECGRQALAALLKQSTFATAYGVVGSFIAIMLWTYLGTNILFFGAEYIQAILRRRENKSTQ